MRPFALRPQLLPVLRQVKEGRARLLLSVRSEQMKFHVGVAELPPDVDDGAAKVQRFLDQTERGEVDLSSVYPRHDNEALAALPEIATRLAVKGRKAG
jgi:hypothetical protein